MRNLSEHRVAIRSPRDDVLQAVQRDFGTVFKYWKLDEGQLPEGSLKRSNGHAGAHAYLVADDLLLPTTDGGEKVRVAVNTKLQAVASSSELAVVPDGAPSDGEKRGEGRSAMPLGFN